MLRNARYMSSVLGINPSQIIHVGADKGQDRAEYIKLGCRDIIWCEADPRNVAYLINRYPDDTVISGVVWNDDLESVNFYQFNNSAQNSAVPPDSLNEKNSYGVISVPARMLDTVLATKRTTRSTLLVVDVQGAELEVLEGAKKLLHDASFVVIEIALKTQGYTETPSQESINLTLAGYGFKPSISRISHDESYKDQLFLKSRGISVFRIRISDYIFDILMKARHGLRFYHFPKYHYFCSQCNE